MPELPEVETTRRGIAPYVEGQTIERVIIRQHQLRWPVPNTLDNLVSGLIVRAVSRRAKYLLLETQAGTLLCHLGMSGNLRIVTAEQAVGKHDHIDFIFSGGICLRFNDPRRFGAVLWTSEPAEEHKLLRHLGPEPLLPSFNGESLYLSAKKRTTPVKSFIMDSRVVVGVGNIYANEALFMAGIHPSRKAGTIDRSHYLKLAECIREVLQEAIRQGGTTLKDFVNEAGKPGYFQQQLKVYGRSGLPCIICGTALSEIRISNRSTVFCEHCQQ